MTPWQHVTPDLLSAIRARYRLDWEGLHGIRHSLRVLENGHCLAPVTGADAIVLEYFAALHDSCRISDGYDPEHGARGAALALELGQSLVRLTPTQLDLLVEACRTHTHGTETGDPTIGTCWDADRLDLWRVGTCPDPRYLSTEAARDPAMIRAAIQRTIAASPRWA